MFKKILYVIYAIAVAAMGYTQYGMIGTPLAGDVVLTPGVACLATAIFAAVCLALMSVVLFIRKLAILVFSRLLG